MPESSDTSPNPHSGRVERTRLAPSPTGALHLGNARTFLINWAMARRRGWRIILRIEDLDGPRVKADASAEVIDTLEWLGLDWDEGPVFQSHDLNPYIDAMRDLARSAMAFPCELSRKEIAEAASAPHPEERERSSGFQRSESRFPPELRPPLEPREFADAATNWRFVCPDVEVLVEDGFVGEHRAVPGASVGDFVIWTQRAAPAYQLAVVVDDHRQGVTQVVRGRDLLDSAARQILIYRALGLRPEPAYTHLPLVLGPDGRRLAKRHGDTRLRRYRAERVHPTRVVGLLAHWCGVTRDRPEDMDAAEFAERFDPRTMPRTDMTLRDEDEQWLSA